MLTASRRILWSSAIVAALVATLAADRGTTPDAEAPPTPFVPVTCWSENFDGVTAPALPVGWKSLTLSGAANLWTTIASGADTAPNRAATGNPAIVSDNVLQSTVIHTPQAASTLSFRHSFNTEAGFDGGVLEITVGSGTWTDIISEGRTFAVGGYNSTISGGFGNPVGGRPGWSGNSGGFITTTINVPAGISGNRTLRWRMGSDSSTGGSGWSIDSIKIESDSCGSGTAPGNFSKVSPENNALTPATSATLVWSPSYGAESYEYCLLTNLTCLNWVSTGTATSATVTGLTPNTTYFWIVRALSAGGGTFANGPASEWRFTTQALPPGAFTKTAPLNGATNRSTALTLNWTASPGATSYEYCLDLTDNGACGSTWESVGNTTTVLIKHLTPGTLHSWHVRAINNGGTTYADAGAASFANFTTAPASRMPLVDLDGDGTGDVFVQEPSTGQWSWQRYKTGGGFLESGGFQAIPETSVTMRNNDDVRTDVTRFNSDTGEWKRLANNGTSYNNLGSGFWWTGWQRHVLYLDGDSLMDMFLYDPSTGIWFQCPASPNVFSCTQGGWNPGWEIYPMRLNNDTFGDFFLIDRNTGRWFWALGTGPNSWSFTYPVTETWFSGWKIYPGDFNGDGLTDLLLHDPNTGGYFIAFSTGSGFTYVQGGWATAWRPLVADLNGDGKDDVFRHDPATGNWTWMISDGAGGFTKVGTGTWSLGWQVHPTDFDGDGKADFFLYHANTGVWYQALNTAPGTFAYTTGTWKPGLTISAGAIGR
jgi:hypothetical protein